MKAIITFHSIDSSGSVLSFAPGAFASLLDGFEQSALPVLTLDELLNPATRRGVTLTFDDGIDSVFNAALPVLRERTLPAHLFLATSVVGSQNRWQGQPAHAPRFDVMSWQQLEQLHDAGFRIESHTHNHPDMRQLGNAEMEAECTTADKAIERAVGRRPKYFAYPYGYFNAAVRDYVSGRYRAAVTTQLGVLGEELDKAALPRLDSYYLHGKWIQRRLDHTLSRWYLSFRSFLRSVRGTQ